ncbi:MAG: peptidylprolyl isomerase [Clostridia bacterium]|nr:peptidylprolyl isomerase [Clostridia bacterium]
MTKEIENKTEVEEKVVIKGREETIIKYAFITLGIVLALSIAAFVIISSIPKKAVAIGKNKITQDEFLYYYKYQADLIINYKNSVAPDVADYDFLMSEYTNGYTYSQAAAQRALGTILETYVVFDLANGDDPDYAYDKVELDEALASFKEEFENYAKENDMKLDEVAQGLYGCSYKSLLKAYEMSWVANKYQEDKIAEFESKVTEEQQLEYYNTFKESMDTVTVRHILIATFDVETGADYTEEQLAAAKTLAEEVYQKVLDGGDFLELAIEYSADPGVADNEAIYQFKKDETDLTEFADWAFAAEVGDIGLIESYIGYHIVELMDRTDYEDLKDTAKYNVAYGEMAKILEEIESRDEYAIGYFDAYYEF